MHRSSSSSRVSEEFFSSQSSSSSDTDQQLVLPTYDPLSHVAKKQRSRLRSAEFAVHLIPLVLVLCATILWFFSTPEFNADVTFDGLLGDEF
uniref:Transmembrane protein n=1 Tax=Fagus sylvatica TaxID=28930 RepID=A0A2N9FTK8_FAGSY